MTIARTFSIMQTMFRLPWASERSVDKAIEYAKPRTTPVVEITSAQAKRKRGDMREHGVALASPPHKRRKGLGPNGVDRHLSTGVDKLSLAYPSNGTDTTVKKGRKRRPMACDRLTPKMADGGAQARTVPLPESKQDGSENGDAPSSTKPGVTPSGKVMDDVALKEVIEAQFNLEILLKHREMRLIEQELAKCQISQEQLRRCQLIPYPGQDSLSMDVSVANGTALEPASGFSHPQEPAPWGVADGPYSRHYAKWLIPDQRFDSVSEYNLRPPVASKTPAEGRSTRGSVSIFDRQPVTGARQSRVSSGGGLQALPTTPAAQKDKGGPVVVKRSADQQLVKLVCRHCQRFDFSSAQGFLNHCRIAHHEDYKSHEIAAEKCGQPVEAGEVQPASATHEAHPPLSTSAASGTPFVHPLNRSGPTPASMIGPISTKWKNNNTTGSGLADNPKPPPNSRSASTRSKSGENRTPYPPPSQADEPAPFVPSPDTPHLSALLQKGGFGMDMTKLVTEAKTRVDLESIPESSSDDDDEQATALDFGASQPAHAGIGAMRPSTAGFSRPAARAGMSPAPLDRPPSRKGHRQPSVSHSIAQTRTSSTTSTNSAPTFTTPNATNSAAGKPSQSRLPASPNPADKLAAHVPASEPGPTNAIRPDLSPHTLESNPGLVSDRDDDFDDASSSSVRSDAAAVDTVRGTKAASPASPHDHTPHHAAHHTAHRTVDEHNNEHVNEEPVRVDADEDGVVRVGEDEEDGVVRVEVDAESEGVIDVQRGERERLHGARVSARARAKQVRFNEGGEGSKPVGNAAPGGPKRRRRRGG